VAEELSETLEERRKRYLRLAAQARELANAATDLEAKRAHIFIEEQWTRLAELMAELISEGKG
jgi:hypothetical protein